MGLDKADFRRAWKDARHEILDTIGYQVFAVILTGSLSGLEAAILWEKTTLQGWQVGLITFASVIGIYFLVLGMVYLKNLCYAPSRIRKDYEYNLATELTHLEIVPTRDETMILRWLSSDEDTPIPLGIASKKKSEIQYKTSC